MFHIKPLLPKNLLQCQYLGFKDKEKVKNYSSFLSGAAMKHSDQKQLSRGKIYLACTSRSQFIIAGSGGRNSRKSLRRNHGRKQLAGSFPGSLTVWCSACFLHTPGNTSKVVLTAGLTF